MFTFLKDLTPQRALTITLAFLLCSCIQSGGKGTGSRGLFTGGDLNNGTIDGGTATTTLTPTPTQTPLLEILTIADVSINDTSFKRKITIPKNFNEFLILDVANASSLAGRFLKVRFLMGVRETAIEVDAFVGRTNRSQIDTEQEVINIDMRQAPFRNLRLLYDLFDYTNYTSTQEPTNDPRNELLFCRGLKVEHDPTFSLTPSNPECDTAGEVCNYAYAKIRDQGLVDDTSGNDVVTYPSFPNIDFDGNGIDADAAKNMLGKCLPDRFPPFFTGATPNLTLTASTTATQAVFNQDILSVNGVDFKYVGPYQAVDVDNWELKATAAIASVPLHASSPTGIFSDSLDGSVNTGLLSYMFPRGGRLNLKQNIQYVGGNTDPLLGNQRTQQTNINSGLTEMMDGCNIRVTNTDRDSGEGISSCNVTAKIQIFDFDPVTQQRTLIVETTKVKLQVIRPSIINTPRNPDQGVESFITTFKSCFNSRSCGQGECCYNGHCWRNDLISQCVDDGNQIGLKGIGSSCGSDYECSSLCCGSSRTCNIHNLTINNQQNPILCNKAPGAACVAKEWCRKETVQVCRVFQVGFDAFGAPTCALRCENEDRHGDCEDGICRPVVRPTPEPFDPTDPNFDCSAQPVFPN